MRSKEVWVSFKALATTASSTQNTGGREKGEKGDGDGERGRDGGRDNNNIILRFTRCRESERGGADMIC